MYKNKFDSVDEAKKYLRDNDYFIITSMWYYHFDKKLSAYIINADSNTIALSDKSSTTEIHYYNWRQELTYEKNE